MSSLDSGQIEARVREALAALSIVDWEWIPIDPQIGDTADFCAEYGFDLPHCANTIVVGSRRGAASYAACLVRGCDRLDVNPDRAAIDGCFQGIVRVCGRHA